MALIDLIDPSAHVVLYAGLATFVFGFGAGAMLNLYLIAISSPLISQLRGSLNYKSSVLGDGVLLPVVNMVVVSFLLTERELIGRDTIVIAGAFGIAVTSYFHVVQAVRGLVNWAMPTPWRWNLLGAWHAAYMLAVATLLSLFYVVCIVSLKKRGGVPADVVVVTAGIALFFVLLRLDYASVSMSSLLPRKISRPS